MIGDVLKAKNKLGKIIGKSELKGLLKYMKDDLSYSTRLVNVDSFVNTVVTHCGKDCRLGWGDSPLGNPGSLWGEIKEVIKLLSTRPHTSRSGNFYKYVYGSIKDIGHYVKGASKDPKETYKKLKKYLTLSKKPKKEPDAEGYKRHENLNDKMGSLREVNRLKILVTALSMALLNKVEKQRAEADKGSIVEYSFDKTALRNSSDSVRKWLDPEGRYK